MSRGYEDEYDDGGRPDDRLPPDEAGEASAARRTNVPGIFLIICGVLNLLVGLFELGNVAFIAVQPAEEIAKQQDTITDAMTKIFPQAKEEIEKEKQKQAAAPEQLKTKAVVQSAIFTAILFVTGLVPLVGGIRMRALRSYGLAVTGAIVTAIPCLSPSSCPCGLGLIFGIWALVVLLNADVKAAFR
jgi:uncharacterized membrane protein HdeD (DUF308 family)